MTQIETFGRPGNHEQDVIDTQGVNEAGEALPPRTGILMNLVVRKPDGWKIVDSQNTDIVEEVFAPPHKTVRAA
jgi:hypothetical protein